MKRDLLIVIISGLLMLFTSAISINLDIRYILFTIVYYVIFLGYFVPFIKEVINSKTDGRPYKSFGFPAKNLAIANGTVVLMAIGLCIMDLASHDMFRGLIVALVTVFVLPVIIGIFIVLLCVNYIIKKKKQKNAQ